MFPLAKVLPVLAALAVLLGVPASAQQSWKKDSMVKLEKELTARHGEGQRPRIERGLKQVAEFWRDSDGDAAVFEDFVRRHFIGDQAELDTLFARCEKLFEQLDGHMLEIVQAFRLQVDLDAGPIMPYDEIFAAYDPSAHVTDDLFNNKLAFTVLLNFPLTTLEERLREGPRWTRRQWAEARLAQRFSRRVPAEVNLAIAKASSEAQQYISEYNIWMH
ncbi:MAG TPA: hypothetical protein PLK67_16875, partial [Bryobacteraceae bacterium]|nr:hypothetical protein [Bryobacteraceae bacterium]